MSGVIPAPEIILSLLAGLLAAGGAWAANGLLVPAAGAKGIAFLTPLLEETAKTAVALALRASILWTHVVFGLIEALVELRRRGLKGLSAGWLGLASHSVFGLITSWFYSRNGFLPALAPAYLAHAAWNMAVIVHSRRHNRP